MEGKLYSPKPAVDVLTLTPRSSIRYAPRYQSGSSKWFDDFWISADDGKNWCMNGDKMPFGQRSAGTIIQIPRHLPDWAPSKLPELPAGDMNTDYHPFPPIVICGGLNPVKGRLNDCWKRHRAPVKMCIPQPEKKPEDLGWIVLIVVLVLMCIAGRLVWYFYNK